LEERLFAHRRDLFTRLDLVFMDTTSLYFEGAGGHPRRYGRHEDIEDPDHAKGLIAQRSRAREQRLMMHFLALSPDAAAYYDGLEQRRLALADIYPVDAAARAISDGLAFQAFSAEYITNILAACRTEVYGVIANDGFAGAKVHRTLDRIQSALFRSLLTLRRVIPRPRSTLANASAPLRSGLSP
jgi:hypothetical protein